MIDDILTRIEKLPDDSWITYATGDSPFAKDSPEKYSVCRSGDLKAHVRKLEADNAKLKGCVASFALEDSICYEWDGEDYRGRCAARQTLAEIKEGENG